MFPGCESSRLESSGKILKLELLEDFYATRTRKVLDSVKYGLI
jgi:hypothetical protein